MARSSSEVPGYDGNDTVSGTQSGTSAYSGRPGEANDPTNEPGQYPVDDSWSSAFFGGTLPDGTGAPGTQGARYGNGTDPTAEPGQTLDGLTGISEHDITSTGAPGSRGAQGNTSGSDTIQFTRPGSSGSGPYASDTVTADVSGPGDWTQANMDGYASGGPKLPGMHEPQAGTGPFQPKSGGRVLRGGRDVRP